MFGTCWVMQILPSAVAHAKSSPESFETGTSEPLPQPSEESHTCNITAPSLLLGAPWSNRAADTEGLHFPSLPVFFLVNRTAFRKSSSLSALNHLSLNSGF